MPLVPLLTSLFLFTQPQEIRRRSQRGGDRVQRGTAIGRHLFAPRVPVPNRLAIRVYRRGSGERCVPLLPHPDNLGNPISDTAGAIQLCGRVSRGITYLTLVREAITYRIRTAGADMTVAWTIGHWLMTAVAGSKNVLD